MGPILEALAQYGIAGIFLAVLDGLGRWVISLAEADALGVEHEIVEWIEPDNDGLES